MRKLTASQYQAIREFPDVIQSMTICVLSLIIAEQAGAITRSQAVELAKINIPEDVNLDSIRETCIKQILEQLR